MNIHALINALTALKELDFSDSSSLPERSKNESNGIQTMIGKKCIIRTYSAGVHYGEIAEKSGSEVIVKNSRRLWQWKAKESISLSAVAKFGIDQSGSKVCAPVDSIWLDAIELIPCTDDAIKSIEEAAIVKAS